MLNSLEDFEYLNNKKPIGEGAFSKVYKIKLLSDNQIYALKEIDLKGLSKGDKLNLKEEIKIHKSVNHKNIIKFYDVIQIFNIVYILLEYCELNNLFNFIDAEKGMNEDIALYFFYQITESINYLHSNNIIHRDIKPENILITKDFIPKICDFGWSSEVKDTIKYSICGTYEYMAPEVILEKPYDFKIDCWALGILLYELLFGYPPYKAGSIEEIKHEIITNDVEYSNKISKNIVKLMKNLLKRNIKSRYTSTQILNYYTENNINKSLSTQNKSLLIKQYNYESFEDKKSIINNSRLISSKCNIITEKESEPNEVLITDRIINNKIAKDSKKSKLEYIKNYNFNKKNNKNLKNKYFNKVNKSINNKKYFQIHNNTNINTSAENNKNNNNLQFNTNHKNNYFNYKSINYANLTINTNKSSNLLKPDNSNTEDNKIIKSENNSKEKIKTKEPENKNNLDYYKNKYNYQKIIKEKDGSKVEYYRLIF